MADPTTDTRPTVAVVGASNDRSKFGNRSVRAHVQSGFRVFPINPRGGEIEGLPAYVKLSDVPVRPLNRITLYVPPTLGLAMLDEIAAIGCDELWLNPGAESPELIEQAQARGLNTIVACSIVAVGIDPHAMH